MLRIVIKQGLGYQIFIGLLSSIINASKHTKCVLLSKQKCEIQPTLINLHFNECNLELHFHPFSVKLDRYVCWYLFQVKRKI